MEFVEQSRIFDCNDGLSGEIRQQGDVLVGERLDLDPPNHNNADDRISLQHWRCEDGPVHFFLAAEIRSPAILRVCENIVNVHDATLQHGAARRRASILMN